MTNKTKMAFEQIIEIPLTEVKIRDDRYRKDMGDIESLAESIKNLGQMIPIIISESNTLIAGERRIEAHKLLKKSTINAVVYSNSEVLHRIWEITENKERKAFTWEEDVLATEDLHQLYKSIQGNKWSQRDTERKAGLSHAGLVTDLSIAKALKEDPEIFKGCKTKEHALKTLQRYKIDEAIAEVTLRKTRTNYGKKAGNYVFHGDCLQLLDTLPEGRVNAMISDPFYGINIEATKKLDMDRKIKIYDDSPELYFDTIQNLVKKLNPVMSKNSWVLMFCRQENVSWLIDQFISIGYTMDTCMGIWSKGIGQSNHPNLWFAKTYESFVYGYRGNVSLVREGQSNVLSYQGVIPMEKDHPVQKPLALMEELISRHCLPGHIVLDPMCGSGTTLVAAIKKGCIPMGFELDEKYYNVAINRVADTLNMKDAGKLDLVT